MKRFLGIALAVLIAIPMLVWGGFQIWLSRQPEDLQVLLRTIPAAEFWRLVREEYTPREVRDFGGYGRREYPGRGHSPWVLRANLDDQVRILLLALAPETWLSLHTPTGSLHQFWRGEVAFTGTVYDTYHGKQPTSGGRAFFKREPSPAFLLYENGRWIEAPTHYRGHEFLADGAEVRLRYALGDAPDPILVTLTPELREPPAEGRQAGERVGLVQRIDVERNPKGQRLALRLHPGARESSTEARPRIEIDGGRLVGSAQGMRVELQAATAELTRWFGEPTIELAAAEASTAAGHAAIDAATSLIEGSDCLSCHHPNERMTGPSWQQIAQRHAAGDRGAEAATLGRRIRDGGSGQWGAAAMPPHPALSNADAERIAWAILAIEASDLPPAADADARKRFDYSYAHDSEAPPSSLHPAFRKRRLDSPPFTPAVGGLALLADGRLAVATWDRDGAVFAVDHWDDDEAVTVERIAEGLQEPLGLASVGDALYVLQKQELTQLLDHDADGRIDEYRTLNAEWQTSGNFHEFAFGLVEREGFLYGGLSACVEKGGKSCATQLPDRGRIFRIALEDGRLEFVASGFRTPNGLGLGTSGELFVTDNQGDWLPASKLIQVSGDDAFYGWRSPLDSTRAMPRAEPPALWLPHHEVGNSPTQPLLLHHGPHAGQMIFGDVYNGGLKRAALEEVAGRLQGAAFHFTGGLSGGVNRILEDSTGRLVLGEVGNPGNWAQMEKDWYGLEVLETTGEIAFEPRLVRATPEGFEIELTQPIASDLRLDASTVHAEHWFYVPSERYGGPKFDPKPLDVRNLELSPDRRVITFETPGREAGRVVYLRLDASLRSESGAELWVNEAWYTLNAIPSAPPSRASSSATAPAATDTPTQRTRGVHTGEWRKLFDGTSFDGWRNYGAEDGEPIEGWAIEEGALRMTRVTSYLRFAFNFLNPFAKRPLLDLRSEEKFGPHFELRVDWRISPGGNSGIFYLVPDDTARVAWKLGLEMQVLDNEGHSDGAIRKHRAGDLYDLVASRSEPVRPVGEWNTARIRVDGDHLQHWLNDELVVDVRRSGPQWEALVAESKFSDREGYGQAARGHIVLQDHGDAVWYRNIEVREFAPHE